MIRFSVLSGQTCCCAGDSLVKKAEKIPAVNMLRDWKNKRITENDQ